MGDLGPVTLPSELSQPHFIRYLLLGRKANMIVSRDEHESVRAVFKPLLEVVHSPRSEHMLATMCVLGTGESLKVI